MSTRKLPDREGFWWGKWRIAGPGTYDNQPGVSAEEASMPPSNEWEVMHVVEADNELKVMVPGVAVWQPLENFVWGYGPLMMR
jgi:hypothetical protein